MTENDVSAENPLRGKTIIFLGSSVTYGSASAGKSFVDFLREEDGVTAIKEAVSGTTLVDDDENSYISRLRRLDRHLKPDLLVCQLSTNDASQGKPIGDITDNFDAENFDRHSVAGAIEYILAYVRDTYGCPVVFYTGTRYDSKQYAIMVSVLLEISRKWAANVIDLWNNPEMNSVSEEDYCRYMANGIHPTLAGYRDWWLPVFEKELYSFFETGK